MPTFDLGESKTIAMTRANGVWKICILLAGIFLMQCSKAKEEPATNNSAFAKGADVGWITEMEAKGLTFHNTAGAQQDVLQILKDKGINSIRLRAWVNPADGWNNTKDVVVKAKRAKALGMKLMIDFHYSDTWADPGHQTKPAAWVSLDLDGLKAAVYNYTKGVIDTLQQNGVKPDWVQVGNETNDGMLWETGRASASMGNFALMVTAGYNAVKSVDAAIPVIVHLSNGWDNGLFRWMFDGLKANGGSWDVIGLSLYPSYAAEGAAGWSAVNAKCLANMNDLVQRYQTPVMIVEVGMPADDPATAKLFLTDIIAKTRSIAGDKGLGVFYWEPECYNKWSGYSLGAFDNTGKPTAAMDAFLE